MNIIIIDIAMQTPLPIENLFQRVASFLNLGFYMTIDN